MGSPSTRTHHHAIRRRMGPLAAIAVLSALALAPVGTARATTVDGAPPAFLRFSVQDPGGNFFPHGEVEFCLQGGGCLYADIDRGYPGQFRVPAAKLVPNGLYQVIVYDPDVDVVYEVRDWRYVPEDHDPGYDILLGVDKFLVFAQFRGLEGGGAPLRDRQHAEPGVGGARRHRAGRVPAPTRCPSSRAWRAASPCP
jgi:hypothetical protein